MANRTFAIHTSEENVRRIDEWAEKLRRSRNSLFNEAIEVILNQLDGEERAKFTPKKKAGKH